MKDVVSIGILVADVIAKPMTALPEKGKLMPIERITLHSGGCALSSAIDMKIIGLDTAVVGKIGNDGFGSYLTGVLEEAGITSKGLAIGRNSQTSASVVVVGNDSERSFIHCFGANGEFTYEDIDFDFVKEYKLAFFTGVNLMESFDGKPLGRAVKKAKELGLITIMDTAWDASGRWMELVEDSLPYLDYFIPSYDEAALIAKKDKPSEIADVFMAHGVRNVAIKLGKDGCYIKAEDGTEFTIPTFLNIKAVETTGAGDAFSSGFITGIINGWPLEKCGLFANAVGTFSVSQIGASTGIKSMEETIDFIKKQGREW
ncbi:MAG: carbohydrate kinase family protein [Clostridia bacterium]|nr:carbohydrate kinase family protein [Clostridia bacterium]MBN2882509.1 carbohydrate kinase family protein [Clostridia bacterium]